MIPNPAPPGSKLDHIVNTWRPRGVVEQIECEDGYKLSVQASGMHYCTDANDSRRFYWQVNPGKPPLPFSTVEVLARDLPACWAEYASGSVHAFVPIPLVRELIAAHGGEKGSGPTQLDRIEALLERIAENTTGPTVNISNASMANLARVGSGLPARVS